MRKFYDLYSNIGGVDAIKTSLDGYTDNSGLPKSSATYPYTPPLLADPYAAPAIPLAVKDISPSVPNLNVPDKPTVTANVNVAGHIYDKKSQSAINNATITLVDLTTKKPYTAPLPIQGSNDYIAWSDDPSNTGVKFDAPGYDSLTIPINTLAISPDVYLAKSFPWWIILAVLAAVAIFRKRTGKVGALETKDIFPIFLIIGGVIGVTLIMKVLKKLGLVPGLAPTEESNPNSPWKPTYWQGYSTYTYGITEDQAKDFASTIYNAFGLFSDDYSAILSVFQQMKTKSNVSYLAWKFEKEYGVSLLSFLQDGGGILPWDGLSSDHMDTLIKLVDSLPTN